MLCRPWWHLCVFIKPRLNQRDCWEHTREHLHRSPRHFSARSQYNQVLSILCPSLPAPPMTGNNHSDDNAAAVMTNIREQFKITGYYFMTFIFQQFGAIVLIIWYSLKFGCSASDNLFRNVFMCSLLPWRKSPPTLSTFILILNTWALLLDKPTHGPFRTRNHLYTWASSSSHTYHLVLRTPGL